MHDSCPLNWETKTAKKTSWWISMRLVQDTLWTDTFQNSLARRKLSFEPNILSLVRSEECFPVYNRCEYLQTPVGPKAAPVPPQKEIPELLFHHLLPPLLPLPHHHYHLYIGMNNSLSERYNDLLLTKHSVASHAHTKKILNHCVFWEKTSKIKKHPCFLSMGNFKPFFIYVTENMNKQY